MPAKDEPVRRYKHHIPDFSNAKKLIEQHKSSKDFEQFIAKLSLEELIALKLEISGRLLKGRFYGVNLLRSMGDITKDAVIRYSMSVSRNGVHMARILGVSKENLQALVKDRFNYYFYIPEDNIEKK